MFKFIFLILVITFSSTIQSQENSFKDKRDGNTYKIIKIGNQSWMAANLRFYTKEAVTYNNKNIDENGYLYDWETAQKVCPVGWHLPNDKEWNEFIMFLGGKNRAGGKLKAIDGGWSKPNRFASNSFGFSSYPSGIFQGGEFHSKGESTYYWSSEAECTSSYALYLTYKAGFADIKVIPKTDMLSIRCIKN